MQDHRSDPDRNTGEFREDELRPKNLSPTKIGVWSPGTRYQAGALMGWFDLGEQIWNELNETRSAALPRQSRNRVYHLPVPEFDGVPAGIQCHPGLPANYSHASRWKDFFRGYAFTSLDPAGRFPASNWEELESAYTVQPDYITADADELDPSDVHDRQAGLGSYTDPEPCGHDDVSSCHCCLCPNCGSVATRYRVTKTPDFACGNPSCDTVGFEEPDVRPARRGE